MGGGVSIPEEYSVGVFSRSIPYEYSVGVFKWRLEYLMIRLCPLDNGLYVPG